MTELLNRDSAQEKRRRQQHQKLTKSVLSSHGSSASKDNSSTKRKQIAAVGASGGSGSALGHQYRSLQVNRKNSLPFDTNSNGDQNSNKGSGGGGTRAAGFLGQRSNSRGNNSKRSGAMKNSLDSGMHSPSHNKLQQSDEGRHRKATFSSSQKRVGAMNRSLII